MSTRRTRVRCASSTGWDSNARAAPRTVERGWRDPGFRAARPAGTRVAGQTRVSGIVVVPVRWNSPQTSADQPRLDRAAVQGRGADLEVDGRPGVRDHRDGRNDILRARGQGGRRHRRDASRRWGPMRAGENGRRRDAPAPRDIGELLGGRVQGLGRGQWFRDRVPRNEQQALSRAMRLYERLGFRHASSPHQSEYARGGCLHGTQDRTGKGLDPLHKSRLAGFIIDCRTDDSTGPRDSGPAHSAWRPRSSRARKATAT